MNHWREECGVFGIWGDPEASHMTYLGLYAQQHRGQESVGIVSLERDADQKVTHHIVKGMGLVADVMTKDKLSNLKGEAAIGHVRYSTTGESHIKNAQPLTAEFFSKDPIAIAHNGNIRNADFLRESLSKEGFIFEGSNDSECFLHLIKQAIGAKKKYKTNQITTKDIAEILKESLPQIKGAFSLVILTQDGLIAARDSQGFRPLVLGKRKDALVVASESCAFDLIDAKLIREVKPGEIFFVSEEGEGSIQYETSSQVSRCVFEHIYFSRPDSIVFDRSVYKSRVQMGRALAREVEIDADLVVPVPDSGVSAAIGFSKESGIPFEFGIIRNHYVGRTFIQPSPSVRSLGVRIKHNPQPSVLKGKRVILVDDSIVRGTTSQKIIEMVRHAGAKEVHFCVSSPPTRGPCYYGIDTQEKEQLIAASKSIAEIRAFIKADSLHYLSIKGLMSAVSGQSKGENSNENELPKNFGFCAACFDGKYPI